MHRRTFALLMFTALCACGGETRSSSSNGGSKPTLEARLDQADLVFCFCRHGCGPGLDGFLAVTATNSGKKSLSADVRGIWLRGATTLHIERGGPGLLYNSPPFTLAPEQSRTISLSLQPDTDSTFPSGAYEVELDFDVDGESVTTALGSITIPYLPNNDCG